MQVGAREEIYSRLFRVLQSLNPETDEVPGDGTLATAASRRFRPHTLVQAQPALFMLETGEDAFYQLREGPRTTHLTCQVVVYSRHNDPNEVPGTALNNLLDQIEYTVRPGPHEQTLDGLVSWVRFSARTTLYEGALASQAISILGFQILSTV